MENQAQALNCLRSDGGLLPCMDGVIQDDKEERSALIEGKAPE